tara:strand:+ start:802 stop:954 length:153 start_codon:yes stop_codon:yes gene_type:complete
MIEIFLEAPIELQILIMGGITALIVVLVKGNGDRDNFNRRFKQDQKWRKK